MRKTLYLITLILLLSACQTDNKQLPDNHVQAEQNSSSKNITKSEDNNSETAESQKAVYQKISAEDAKKMMDEQSVVIVDVRTEAEYKGGHILNAILLPNETIGKEAPAELPDKQATILVYCRSGNRSRQAANKLIELGYQNIYDFGGIGDWKYDIISE